jgi:signal-transduction protein with cAMP-binding, CBS, and nucleotidyltransferase domain
VLQPHDRGRRREQDVRSCEQPTWNREEAMQAMEMQLQRILENKPAAIFSVPPETTVAAAVELINAKRVGAVLVMMGAQLVGIFTERDVLRRVVGERRNPDTTRVQDVMTRDVVVMRPTATVQDAMAVVAERRCRHLPVVEDGRVLGIVSAGDLNYWLIRNREVDIQQLVEYISGNYPA